MLKFVFWALLCANGLLFAYGRGFLGSFEREAREPARLRNQLAAERLVLLSASQVQAMAASAAVDAATDERDTESAKVAIEPVAAPSPRVACVETDAFTAFDARRFETRLARLDLGSRQTRLTVPFHEVTSYMVYLPAQGGKEGADRRVADLRERGVTNFFVVQGDVPLRWAISLGVFKSEAAARTQMATLAKRGVANVRILPRGPQSQRFAYRFRNIDTAIKTRIVEAGRGMPAAILHICR